MKPLKQEWKEALSDMSNNITFLIIIFIIAVALYLAIREAGLS